jgi:mannose-6-phosphate isomerase-like protein (cupin superfamily)
MRCLDLATLLAARNDSGRLYQELLRSEALSVGVYELPAGRADPQRPHGEDEVYVAVRGRGKASIEDETFDVAAGTVLYVPASAVHRFYDIEEDLALVVIFAPPEGGTSC